MNKQRRYIVVLLVSAKSAEERIYSVIEEPRKIGKLKMFYLFCSEVCDEMHYLKIVLDKTARFPGAKLHVPHQLVVLISDQTDSRTIRGFADLSHS